MDWTPVNAWTSALYMVIRSIHLAKNSKFKELASPSEVIKDASNWLPMVANYNSVLLAHPFGRGRGSSLRRDPEKYFGDIMEQIAKMLVQDLVVIFDQMMDEALAKHNEKAGLYPQSKIEKLSTHLNPKFDWARQGCLELIAARNVLAHTRGRWNKESIRIIKDFVSPPPVEGEALKIGFPMLFRYKRAMRTFLNEVKARNT